MKRRRERERSQSESEDDEEDRFQQLHDKWLLTSEDKKALKEEVGQWKTGRWSIEELRTLKRNIRAFKKKERVKDLSVFMFDNDRGKHGTLYRYIAKDIQRPLYTIYRKMLIVFDELNRFGKWTKEQEKELLRLHGIHGNSWKTIGLALGASGYVALSKYRCITKREKTGVWSECEKQSLAQAVEHYQQLALEEGEEEKVTMLDDIRLPSGVSWDTIAELVPTRNGIQCRHKWLFNLSWSQRGGRRRWGAQDDLKLLQRLSVQDDLADEEEVEWEELSEGWESVRSPHHLRSKWACLRRVVPNYHIKTFQENLEYLVEHRMPALERQLAQAKHPLPESDKEEEDSPD